MNHLGQKVEGSRFRHGQITYCQEFNSPSGLLSLLFVSFPRVSLLDGRDCHWKLWEYFVLVYHRGLVVKNLPAKQETWVQLLSQEDPLEKEMPTHFSILAWRIPWTEKPGELQSMGSQRVGHDLATKPQTISENKTVIYKGTTPHLRLSADFSAETIAVRRKTASQNYSIRQSYLSDIKEK